MQPLPLFPKHVQHPRQTLAFRVIELQKFVWKCCFPTQAYCFRRPWRGLQPVYKKRCGRFKNYDQKESLGAIILTWMWWKQIDKKPTEVLMGFYYQRYKPTPQKLVIIWSLKQPSGFKLALTGIYTNSRPGFGHRGEWTGGFLQAKPGALEYNL